MTPPLERISKLSPKWIRPFWVLKAPNPYQVIYAAGAGIHIVHIHHTKLALLDFITQELQHDDDPLASQPLGYLPSAFSHKSVVRDQARGTSRVTTPQPNQSPSPLRGLVAGLLVGLGPPSTNQNPAAPGPDAALGPAAEPGLRPAYSLSAVADTLPANQNSAAQGTVTGRGISKAWSTVMRTRYERIVKSADHFSMMASHCPVPSPPPILDVLGLSILPTTFRAVLFMAEDGVARVAKWPRDHRRIHDWLKDQARVQINSQKQPTPSLSDKRISHPS